MGYLWYLEDFKREELETEFKNGQEKLDAYLFNKAEARFRKSEERFDRKDHRVFAEGEKVDSSITYVLPKDWLPDEDTNRVFEQSQIEAT